MPKKALGIYSSAMFESIAMAERMQADAVLHIREQFSVEDDDSPLSLDNLTYERLQRMLSDSEKGGNRDELEAKLAEMIMPIVEQVIMTSTQQGQVQE